MQRKTAHTHFIRFLKDEKFIEWKLFPTEELNIYWRNFLQQHPDEQKNVALAEEHFRLVNTSPHEISPEKKLEAIRRLEQSLRIYSKKRRIRRFSFTAAACATVFILSLLHVQKETRRLEQGLTTSKEYIMGNELESEDILFVTGNKIVSFPSDINVYIQANRIAQVRDEHEEAKHIALEQHATNKLIVPYGKRSRIVLSDGTRVWLNSGSTLEFPSIFSEDTREVFLSGEMFIEVVPDKNKSFHVQTSGYEIKVHGTKFNVSSYSGALSSVVLVEGNVSLRSDNEQEVFLSPEDRAVYSVSTGTFETRKVDVHAFTSWKEGYLTFEDTPVTEALKQIGRYYNLSFNLDDNVSFHGLTCTGKIILSSNLDNVMKALTLISSTKYRKENKRIYIYKE